MGRNQRRRANTRKSETGVTGVAWYRRDQWARLRNLSVDGTSLDERYEDWLNRAEENMRELQRRGVTIRPVDVDLDELLQWCDRTGRQLDGAARAAFTAERLRVDYEKFRV